MDFAIEAYLPETRFEDFEIEIEGQTYKLPSLNRLSWDNLVRIYRSAKDNKIDFLEEGFFEAGFGLPEDMVYALPERWLTAILDEWFERVGATPSKISQIIHVIESASQEFNYDLRRLLGMDGISEFLTLPLTDCVDIMEMLVRSETSAWTWARLQGYEYPLAREAITATDVVFTTGYKVPKNYSRLSRSSDILDIDALETAQELAENESAEPTPDEEI